MFSELVIKARGNVKKKTFCHKKCGISNAVDGTEDELPYVSEDEDEAEVVSLDSDWDP